MAVFNAPFSNTRSVVELAIAEIISMARRLPEKNAKMHQGVWDKSAKGAHEVRGRKLGIVGYGNIGTQLSVIAESLGMTVYFYDIADKLAIGNARRCSSLEELLESVETVTLHVDGRSGNHGFFGEEEFARMRPRSLFLNLSRGFVVDHAALRRHIESGHIAGAAIDVFPREPKGNGEEFVSELRGLNNVILTPHIGGSTEEAQQDIGEFVSGKLVDFAEGGATSMSVNMPGVALPSAPGTHRLVHLHQNVPGVLATINRVLADHGVNVEGQLLRTRDDLGYVITDIVPAYSDEVLDQLRAHGRHHPPPHNRIRRIRVAQLSTPRLCPPLPLCAGVAVPFYPERPRGSSRPHIGALAGSPAPVGPTGAPLLRRSGVASRPAHGVHRLRDRHGPPRVTAAALASHAAPSGRIRHGAPHEGSLTNCEQWRLHPGIAVAGPAPGVPPRYRRRSATTSPDAARGQMRAVRQVTRPLPESAGFGQAPVPGEAAVVMRRARAPTVTSSRARGAQRRVSCSRGRRRVIAIRGTTPCAPSTALRCARLGSLPHGSR